MNMKLIRNVLLLADFRVIEATDAEQGLELMREDKPDAVLLDIQLPGMDGLEAAQIIKSDPGLANIPVVALTSHAMRGDREKALESGFDGYYTKPFDTRSLAREIADIIGQKATTPEPCCAPPKDNAGKRKILVADDNPNNVRLLEAELEQAYDIVRAYSGREALEAVWAENPDLILLDVMMPEMNGYEVTRQLKSNPETCKIPIILVTVLDGREDKLKGLELGVDEFLTKPVDTAELNARVRSLLHLKSCREQLSMRAEAERGFIEPETIGSDQPFVLIIEDEALHSNILKSYLNELPCGTEVAGDGKQALSIIAENRIDLVLLDLELPDMEGLEVLRKIKRMKNTENTQIVIITASLEKDDRLKGIRLGADDYLAKPVEKDLFLAKIESLFGKKRYLDGLAEKYETALQAAIMDRLTGLYNHTYLKHFLLQEITRTRRRDHRLAMVMIDIDNFKNYNDTNGHLAGDRVLREIGGLIKHNVREIDLSARYGGEEFSVVLPYTGKKEAREIAERVRTIIACHDFRNGETEHITVSMGIAACPEDADTVDDLIQRADESLYRAKREGKNRVWVS